MDSPKVGDKVWYVPYSRNDPRYVEVIRVGRKFFYVDMFRREVAIDRDTLMHRSKRHGHHGRCYLRKEDHDRELARSSAWSRLGEIARGLRPPEVPTENIEAACELLTNQPKDGE
jgi:hypothetical protein